MHPFRGLQLLFKGKTEPAMTLIAIFFPFLSFILRGRILTGIICLILQITLIGWIPAAIWAVISLQNARADRRNRKLIRAMRQG